ncbi:hypothetical protein D8911_01935 [Levilactobacillus brevis]|nr:hypothetical protein D8911_01935 [Levilactobacillus brevis]
MGAVILASLALSACGQQSGSRQQNSSEKDIAFGQTAKPRAWYIVQSQRQPQARMPLEAIVITQKGRALAFQVPKSLTLATAAKLSIGQLKRQGPVWAKQDFRQQRRALIKTTQAELAAEQQNLKRNQNATVVSYATIKTDRRVIVNARRRLARLQRTSFKQPSPQPFSVKRHGREEALHVAAYDFVKSATGSDNQAYTYRQTQMTPIPYTRTSEHAVRIGAATFGYYRGAHAGAFDYALTQVNRGANVTFDASPKR